jgi:DNA-binding MarR family transcriptional regulator
MPRQTLKAVVAQFGHAISHLVGPGHTADASHALSWTEATVIARLARDGPTTAADLARAEGMKPDSMEVAVAALEKMGMVEQRPAPSDGRQLIELTAKGAAARKNPGLRAVRPAGTVHVRSRYGPDADGRV